MKIRPALAIFGCVLMLLAAFLPWEGGSPEPYAQRSFLGGGFITLITAWIALLLCVKSLDRKSIFYNQTLPAGIFGALNLAWCIFYVRGQEVSGGPLVSAAASLISLLGGFAPASIDRGRQRLRIHWLARQQNVTALLDMERELEVEVIDALAGLGTAAVDPLICALEDDRRMPRALAALRRIRDPRAVAPIARLIHRWDMAVSRTAENTLREIGGPEAQAILRERAAASAAAVAATPSHRPPVRWQELNEWVMLALVDEGGGDTETGRHGNAEKEGTPSGLSPRLLTRRLPVTGSPQEEGRYDSLILAAGRDLYERGGMSLLRETYERLLSHNAPSPETQAQVSGYLKRRWEAVSPMVREWPDYS
jgi:hypothetical protein